MDEQRIVEIETKLSHQELLLDQLNAVVSDQQSRLSKLEELARRLAERLQSVEQQGGAQIGDEPPPHY